MADFIDVEDTSTLTWFLYVKLTENKRIRGIKQVELGFYRF
jgi:hypothetical protein